MKALRNLLLRFGRLKAVIERMRLYASWVNFAMLLFLFVTAKPLGIEWYWWILFIATGISILSQLDVRGGIFEGEIDFIWNKCKSWRDHQKSQKRLEIKLNRILKKLGDEKIGN